MFSARAGARSTDLTKPWHTAPALELSLAYPVGAIAAVLYGSLLPFRLHSPSSLHVPMALFDFGWRSTTFADVVTNVLVYIPIGTLFLMSRAGSHLRPSYRVAGAVLVGAAISLAAESAQLVISERVASWLDVLFNMIGTTMGALLGHVLRNRIRGVLPGTAVLQHRPYAGLVILFTLGILSYELIPFDFLTDTAALHASFLRAHWDLLTPRPPAVDVPPLSPLAHQLAGGAWFALLGFLTARSWREEGADRITAHAAAVKHGLLLAGLIELLQLFTASHVADVGSAFLRSLAVVFGAWVGVFVLDNEFSSPQFGPRRSRIIGLGCAFFVFFQIALILADSRLPDGLNFTRLGTMTLGLPFEALWRSSFSTACGELSAQIVIYSALAGSLSLGLAPFQRVKSARLVAALVVLTAGAVELLEALASGRLDFTNPLIAAVAGAVTAQTTLGILTTLSSPPTDEFIPTVTVFPAVMPMSASVMNEPVS